MTILYRIRQLLFSIAMNAVKKSPKLIEKNGLLSDIPEMILNDGNRCAFIVTTNGFINRETLSPLFTALEKNNIPYSVYTGVVPDPTFKCVEEGVKAYTEKGGGVIVAVGGGSVIDCAKMIGAKYAKPKKPLSKMRGVLKILKKTPPLYAVPTTSGTGSEVTVAAVLTDDNHVKYAFEDFSILPDRALLDASLTLGLSPYMTAITAMDALTHSLEAYTNRFSSRYVKKAAEEAVVLIFKHLENVCKDGSDIKGRTALMRASMLGGRAINRGFVGYVHALAHAVGGKYGIAHGEACAVLLPEVLEAYGKSAEKKLARLARLTNISGESDSELAVKFITEIRYLREKIGIPKQFDALQKKDFDALLHLALKEANPLYPVPKIMDLKGLSEILEKLCKKTKSS